MSQCDQGRPKIFTFEQIDQSVPACSKSVPLLVATHFAPHAPAVRHSLSCSIKKLEKLPYAQCSEQGNHQAHKQTNSSKEFQLTLSVPTASISNKVALTVHSLLSTRWHISICTTADKCCCRLKTGFVLVALHAGNDTDCARCSRRALRMVILFNEAMLTAKCVPWSCIM